MYYRAFWQRRCRAAAAGAVLKPQGGNCAVLPQQTQPDFVLAKDPLFSLLSDAPQELAQIEIGKGEPGIRGRVGGDKKANGISAANPHPVVKGERRPVVGRAIHQTHTRRRKPAIPPTRRPPRRQAPPQTGACETNNCAKTGKCNKKGEFCCKVALCVRRGS